MDCLPAKPSVLRDLCQHSAFSEPPADYRELRACEAWLAAEAATAQAQAEATKAAQRAGIEHAKHADRRFGDVSALAMRPRTPSAICAINER